MTAVHVRNVSEQTLAGLRERAARHGHSMQQEIVAVLDQAASEQGPGQVRAPVRLATVNTSTETTWSRGEIYGETGR
ncbi:MAG: FitA-like ribbon-helix-helix domain-containing protein [Acidimicrobiales bacterium]